MHAQRTKDRGCRHTAKPPFLGDRAWGPKQQQSACPHICAHCRRTAAALLVHAPCTGALRQRMNCWQLRVSVHTGSLIWGFHGLWPRSSVHPAQSWSSQCAQLAAEVALEVPCKRVAANCMFTARLRRPQGHGSVGCRLLPPSTQIPHCALMSVLALASQCWVHWEPAEACSGT